MSGFKEVEGTVIDLIQDNQGLHSSKFDYYILLQTEEGIIHVSYTLDCEQEFNPLRGHIRNKKIKIPITSSLNTEFNFKIQKNFNSCGAIQLLEE
jgi:hypothetical protein